MIFSVAPPLVMEWANTYQAIFIVHKVFYYLENKNAAAVHVGHSILYLIVSIDSC